MKLLTAVIIPAKLNSITDALEVAGFEPMMVASARTAVQPRPELSYRGVGYADPSVVRVELLVQGSDVERAAYTIRDANGATGGDLGQVPMWITDVLHPLGEPTRSVGQVSPVPASTP